jgi:hypothetical protein
MGGSLRPLSIRRLNMEILGHNIAALVKRTFNGTLADNILGLSAETAYSFFFGFFPLLLFAAPLLSLFGNKQQIFNSLLARVSSQIPPDALALVKQVLRDIVFTKNATGLMSIGAILSLWAGAGMFSSLMYALNVAYNVKESRPWWKQKPVVEAKAHRHRLYYYCHRDAMGVDARIGRWGAAGQLDSGAAAPKPVWSCSMGHSAICDRVSSGGPVCLDDLPDTSRPSYPSVDDSPGICFRGGVLGYLHVCVQVIRNSLWLVQ